MRGAECLSDVSVGGGIAATGQSGHGCAAGTSANRHAEAVEHDGLHDSQRIGSIEGIAETRLKLRRVSTVFATDYSLAFQPNSSTQEIKRAIREVTIAIILSMLSALSLSVFLTSRSLCPNESNNRIVPSTKAKI